MGRKRTRRGAENRGSKKPRPVGKKQTETDLNYISKHDYVVIGNFVYVRPYVFEFRTNFKPRWRNRTIFEVFCYEFKHTDAQYWEREVAEGRILVSGKPIKKWTLWDDGMEVVHVIHRHESAVLSTPIEVAADEEGFVVVSKPPSVPIHPCGTYRRNSLQFILKAFYGFGNLLAVHRLDKETSGLVILAKDSATAAKFSEEIKQHKVQKTYLAEVHGIFPTDISECVEPLLWEKREMRGSVNRNGLEAMTSFKRVSVDEARGTSIVECRPLTGRTHQIRIHLAHVGYAIVNDPMYGTGRGITSTSLASKSTQDPQKMTLNDVAFRSDGGMHRSCRTYLASEWSKESLERNGRHLSCAEEGQELSCGNCPQVTNAKNVEVRHMFIHLHALKYESENWSFEVPPPPWIHRSQTEIRPEGSGKRGMFCSMC